MYGPGENRTENVADFLLHYNAKRQYNKKADYKLCRVNKVV